MKKITSDDITSLLDILYQKSINGIEYVSPDIETFANDYLCKYSTVESAAKSMLKNQLTKCTTSGVITGFGGAITLPITIPANISSVLYMQMRMIACTAYMAGYDLHSDQIQTFIYACLAGVSIGEILKKFGINAGTKLAKAGIKKIPGKVLIEINKKIGTRVFTKFGETGLINFGKMIPVVGAIVSGGFDFAETKLIADRAYKMFFTDDMFLTQPTKTIIDVDYDVIT